MRSFAEPSGRYIEDMTRSGGKEESDAIVSWMLFAYVICFIPASSSALVMTFLCMSDGSTSRKERSLIAAYVLIM